MITKKDIIEQLAIKLEISKAEANKNINILLDLISETLKTNDKVQFTGFGSFIAQDKPATKGRNPKTGLEITIPARRVVRFKVGDLLKKKIN
ncbi:HU family DNA-binding protein [Rickettsiales bacterium]|nr:HU family DNA-binding protein [Rickettsiales bacterium]